MLEVSGYTGTRLSVFTCSYLNIQIRNATNNIANIDTDKTLSTMWNNAPM